MKMSPVISVHAEIFEQGFAAHGPMYANLPSYRCYLPASACVPPHPPGPQVNSLLIGGRQTATVATSCLANPLLEDVEEEDGFACGCLVQTHTQTVCVQREIKCTVFKL